MVGAEPKNFPNKRIPNSWFSINWTEYDDRLYTRWTQNIGKEISYYDESSPIFIPIDDEAILPIPIEVEESSKITSPYELNKRKAPKQYRRQSEYKKPRTPVPTEVRRMAMKSAAGYCQKCGSPERFLELHHIDGDPTNHYVGNLMMVCHDCHMVLEEKNRNG